jgi:hypothetical protein
VSHSETREINLRGHINKHCGDATKTANQVSKIQNNTQRVDKAREGTIMEGIINM